MSSQRKPKFGQNFLVDDRARHAIVDALGDIRGRTVLEIGPGHGSLTSILATRAKRLIALELDASFSRELTFKFRDQPHVTILNADVLKTDLAALAREHTPGETLDVIGNLPYYITSDILLSLFAASLPSDAQPAALARAVLMMQLEVADRVAASPGVRDYGLLSATAQMYAPSTTRMLTLPPEAFSPPPDVFSAVVRMDFAPRFTELSVDPAGFDRFLKQSFAQKRKTLANNLRSAGTNPATLQAAWPASIPPQARAEALSLEQMASLFRALNPS